MSVSAAFVTRTAAAALMICAIGAVDASAQTWTMKIGCDTMNDVQHEWMKRYAARVEKASGGRIKTELFPSGQLGGSNNEINGMQLGTIEARVGPGAFLAGVDPRFQILDAPGWFKDIDHAQRTLADPKFRDSFLAIAEPKNLVGVSLFLYGPSSFVSTKPIRKIADMQGLKYRVMGSPMQIQPLKAMGGNASPMPWAETLPALQQGVIDGVKSALPAFTSAKFVTVAKFLTQTDDAVLVSIGMVSKPWLDKLPGRHRMILDATTAAGAGEAIGFANNLFAGNSAGYGLKENDLAMVICLRHFATLFAFTDPLWAKHGKQMASMIKYESRTGEPPRGAWSSPSCAGRASTSRRSPRASTSSGPCATRRWACC